MKKFRKADKVTHQGDVWLIYIKELPKDVTPSSPILALGEVSGHRHEAIGDVLAYKNENHPYLVVGVAGGQLLHLTQTNTQADHEGLELEPESVIKIQYEREYNPFANLIQRVVD